MKDHQHTLLELLAGFETPLVAEIGVGRGDTSKLLLANHPGVKLFMVDTWKPRIGSRRSLEQIELALRQLWSDTFHERDRRVILSMTSLNAAKLFADLLFDLVFIDADHYYESVLEDCTVWYPKVNFGGYLCGHDIDSLKDRSGVWGVRKGVHRFCRDHGQFFRVVKNTWIVST